MAAYYPRQYKRSVHSKRTLEDSEEEDLSLIGKPKVQFKATAKPTETDPKTPNHTENKVASDPEIEQHHLNIQKNLVKYKIYLDAGKARSVDLFFQTLNIPDSIDYLQTQASIQSEKTIYKEIVENGRREKKDYYNTIVQGLNSRFEGFQKIEDYKKKVGEHMLGWVIQIHDLLDFDLQKSYGGLFTGGEILNNINVTAAKGPLYRLLQITFPHREQRDDLFRTLYSQNLPALIEQKFNIDDFSWPMARAYLKAGKLRPADKFYIAVKGAGTDEGNVFFSMRQAHAAGLEQLENEYKTDYAADTGKKGDLPVTGANNQWYIAGRIDDDMDWESDDNIKAKAILCYGKVRPIDKIRMALFGDTSVTDLQEAIREAMEEGMTGEQIEAEYARSFGNEQKIKDGWSLKKEINNLKHKDKQLHYVKNMNNPIFTINSLRGKDEGEKKIDEDFDRVDTILAGHETMSARFIDRFRRDEKKAFPFFCKLSLEDKKNFIDSIVAAFMGDEKLNKYKAVYNLQYSEDPGFNLIVAGSLWDYESFKQYIRYNISQGNFNILRKALKANNYFEEMLTYLFLPSKEKEKNEFVSLLKIDSDIKFFLHVINSKDREWATHYLINLLPTDRKEVFKQHWLYFKKETYVTDKALLKHVEALLWDDPSARIKEERRLLIKANSGLGAAITNSASTSGLSAENEMREVEVDLEMAKFDDGVIDAKEMSKLEEGIENAKETRLNFEETRDKVEGIATMIVQALVAATASVLVPGIGGIIVGGLVGGASNVMVNKIMKNDRYDLNNCGMDFLTGMVDGMMGGLATKGIAAVSKGTGLASKLLKVKIVNEVAEQALGSVHNLGIDIVKGKPAGMAAEDYLKGIFQGMAMNKAVTPYKNALQNAKNSISPPKNDGSTDSGNEHQPDTSLPNRNDGRATSNDGRVTSTDGTVDKPSKDLNADMPQHGSSVRDPINQITDKRSLIDSINAEVDSLADETGQLGDKIRDLEQRIQQKGVQSSKQERKELDRLKKDLKDIENKERAAVIAQQELTLTYDRDTVLNAQQALKDIRDMKLYRSGQEVILYDIPEGSVYLDSSGALIQNESHGKKVMEEVFNSDPQREVGLWKDGSTDPPTYFVVQGSTFDVKFNEHGNYDLVYHTHPASETKILDSLASIGDFRHLIKGKSPKKSQYLESKILTHHSGELVESKFIAETSGDGNWEFKIEYTRRDGSSGEEIIDPKIIVGGKENAYNRVVNEIEKKEKEYAISSAETNRMRKINPDETLDNDKKKENRTTDEAKQQDKPKDSDTPAPEPKLIDEINKQELENYTDREIVESLRKLGTWDEIHKSFGGSVEGKLVLERVKKIRKKIIQDLQNHDAKLLDDAATTETSDMDFNISGPDAGRKVVLLDTKLRKLYGDNYEKTLKISLFTHSGRLTKYKAHEGSKQYQGIVARVNSKSKVLMYARMMHHAKGNPAETLRVESMMEGVDKAQVKKWADRLDGNQRDNYYKLLQEVDALEQRYAKANESDKPILSELITMKQMEANFYSKDAYIAPSSMMKSYDRTPEENQQNILAQMEMITSKISEFHKSRGDVTAEYMVYKYIHRCKLDLQERGIPIPPSMEKYFTLAEKIYTTDRKYYEKNLMPVEERLANFYSFLQELQNLSNNVVKP